MQETGSAPAPSASVSVAKAEPARFGEPIGNGAAVRLADLFKAPATYRGQSVVTEGKVSRVCQEQGCWLALRDGDGDAVVRMHGHKFFVPTTSAGKHARVRATVMLMKDGRECDDMHLETAKLELDATGVELD
jgi:hypothetical protein